MDRRFLDSIDAEEFERHKRPWKYIVDFLRRNKDRAFTAEHIANKIGIHVSEVRSAFLAHDLAEVLDRTYRSPIDHATVEGITYYKYKGD